MDLFMQLSNTLCSFFFLRNFHSVFCLFAMSDLPAKMQKSYAGAVANAIQFWRLFQGIGRKSSPAPSNGKKKIQKWYQPGSIFFRYVSYPLCRSCIRQEPLLHFAQKGADPIPSSPWGKETLLSLRLRRWRGKTRAGEKMPAMWWKDRRAGVKGRQQAKVK